MKVFRQLGGFLELEASGEELEWIRQALNECCNGLRIENFKVTIGSEPDMVERMLNQIGDAYQMSIRQEG